MKTPRPRARTSTVREAVFLNETEAAVVVFELLGYSRLCAALSPLDLGLAVIKYYRHVETFIEANRGRMVKLSGDRVLAAWLANENPGPPKAALAAVAQALRAREEWVAKQPDLDYVVAAAAGPVLAGQVGTEKHKTFDVLGEPVNIAFKLPPIAAARGATHLLAVAVKEHPSIEVEGVELGGNRLRLFRLTDQK